MFGWGLEGYHMFLDVWFYPIALRNPGNDNYNVNLAWRNPCHFPEIRRLERELYLFLKLTVGITAPPLLCGKAEAIYEFA